MSSFSLEETGQTNGDDQDDERSRRPDSDDLVGVCGPCRPDQCSPNVELMWPGPQGVYPLNLRPQEGGG